MLNLRFSMIDVDTENTQHLVCSLETAKCNKSQALKCITYHEQCKTIDTL